MDFDKIVYKPYRAHVFFEIVMIGIGLFSLVAAGILWSEKSMVNFMSVLLEEVLCVGLAYYLHTTSRITIIFEADGLRIINGRHAPNCYVPWNKLSFGYYERSYKRHEYLVLSSEVLSKERLKKLVNRGANATKINVDSTIVIYLDSLQDTSQIRTMVKKRVFLKEESRLSTQRLAALLR